MLMGEEQINPDVREWMATTSSELRHLNKEVSYMRQALESLVRIEHRMIRMEELGNQNRDTFKRLFERLEKVEAELDSWRAFRKFMLVIVGASSALASLLFYFMRG